MPLYNMTELYAATTAIDLVTFANNATSGILSSSFIIAVFFISFLVVKRMNDYVESVMAASFIALMLSIIFRFAGIINFIFPLVFSILLALSLLYVYMTKR